jgi:hypothetical protein
MQNLSKPIPELGGRTWEELEIIEHADGHLLFKDAIRRRGKTGAVETEEVRVKVLRTQQIAEARGKCRRWFGELGLDEERDKDLFDQLEQVCILAIAIRDPSPPYAQRYQPEELATQFDEASLQDVLGRLQALRQTLDVRESHLTENEIWQKIAAVARVGHLGPLTDIAGPEQPSCIVFMATQAMRSPKALAWQQSCGISTPAPSAETSSPPSSAEGTPTEP